jgi:cephalosporin hydroxylase
MGRPIIQFPQDMIAMQEIIWEVQPDLIIETGIAHGGSAVFSASMLALIEYCDAAAAGETLDPAAPRRRVLAIDIDIRSHNRSLIEAHPLAGRIDMIEGSSTDPAVVARARAAAERAGTVLVCLDSNHTADHVLGELEAYAPMTSQGSYCVVFDTVVEDLPAEMFADRPWGPGNSPKTAVLAYLERLAAEGATGIDGASLAFAIDRDIDRKLLISVAPEGYLRRVK